MSTTTGAFQFAVLADGPSDRALIPILRWAVREQRPSLPLRTPLFEYRRPPGAPLGDELARIIEQRRPDLVFVHRDAESMSLRERKAEIPRAAGVVPVVPIRMTEAWLLIDEQAIRKASGNPNGAGALRLPERSRLERLPDPKATLRELLVTASGYHGRRRKRFDCAAAIQRVADFVIDFEPLRDLEAFRELEADLGVALAELVPARQP